MSGSSVKPERSLAVLCPQVAAMWRPSRNGAWTPRTISVASDVRVWWVCPAGHEWSESVRDRAALRRWKSGRVGACGLCLGYHVVEFCACGRQRMVKVAAPPVEYECFACQSAKMQAQRRRERRREEARTDYVADFAESQALLDPIVPVRLPPRLAAEWRREVGPRVRSALENEHGYGRLGTVGAVDQALRRIQNEGDLLATTAELRAAHTAGEPIRFMGRTFWTQGVLHVLGLDVADRPPDRAAVSLENWVRAGVSRVVNRRPPPGTNRTATITRLITDLVEQWGKHDTTGPWRSFFELVPPFIPTTGHMCGRIDVVLTRIGSPDLVVEIDSAHNSRSMEKLQFACAAGATTVWIRWNSGAARQVPGVHVVDLLRETKSLLAPRRPSHPDSAPG